MTEAELNGDTEKEAVTGQLLKQDLENLVT